MGKASGKKPKGMKCKLDTGAGVNIMPLSIYQYINPSEFNEQGKPIGGHGQYKNILKDYNGNPIQQYGIRVISWQMELPILEICFPYCRSRRTHTAWTEYNEENGALHEAPNSLN